MSAERFPENSYVDVPAVLAGTVLAIAISVVFTNFGSAIGLSLTDDARWTGEAAWTGDRAIAGVIATGLWVLWTQVTASMIGGYIAGRLRRPVSNGHEREIRDGAHGLLVWATGTVAVAIAVGVTAGFVAIADDTTDATTTVLTDTQHNAAIIFAFITAASSLVSGVVAWWAATMGGEHRDSGADHSRYVSFRKR